MNMGEFRALTAEVPNSVELTVADNEMFAVYPATVEVVNGDPVTVLVKTDYPADGS